MKTLVFISILLFSTAAFCQIPNAGFENWSIVNDIEEPDNWEIYHHPIFFSSDAITKTTDSYSGNFALQATNRREFFEGYRPGIVTTLFTSSGVVNKILAFVKCDSLEGTGMGKMYVYGYLDSIKHEVGYWETSVLIQNYTLIEIPLNPVQYYDSIEIRIEGFAENAPNGAATGFARLKVDQLNAEMVTGTEDLAAVPAPEVFPNPCHEVLNISYPDGNLSQIQLFDVHGKLVLQQSTERPTIQLETADLPGGTYVLNLLLQDGRRLTDRIIIVH